MRVLESREKNCLVVEDSERGLEAAQGAGIACWVIPGELTRGSDFDSAEKILDSITDLSHLL